MKKQIVGIMLLLNIALLAQVGVGTSSPNSSAILDVDVTSLPANGKKGFLGPRVALSSNTDQTTIPSPATGLLVYNLGTGGLSTEGYLYWNGSEWRKLNNGTTVDPSITSLECGEAQMSPAAFTAGEAYNGVMTVPYTGGNGGSYSSGTGIASTGNTGLTATLQAGDLSFGNGELVYTLTGTPAQSSPNAANFALSFLTESCSAAVSGDVLGIGETVTKVVTMPNSAAAGTLLSSLYSDLPVIDGLRMDLARVDASFYDPRIYNVSDSDQQVSYQTFATQVNENETNLNVTLTTSATPTTSFVQVDANNITYWTTSLAEVLTTNLQVKVTDGVWRWYEFKWWCMEITGSNEKTIFMSVVRKA
ncbi:hypothetical protein UJ101_01035 [Flavobacteriaceae bacterium UJ101]|nr:hypothetical protein UJ101_01035 [Flavobacteriaceae bacterium UJ101]